ncbi:MAG: hypothetical protein AB1758_11985, partial [Candidatus Eremiobacterota bacterium]
GEVGPIRAWARGAFESCRKLALMVVGGMFYHGEKHLALRRNRGTWLTDCPRVRLQRPFLLVPGLNGKPARFQLLTDHLTRDGLNGGRTYYLKQGEIFHDAVCSQPVPRGAKDSEARIFLQIASEGELPPNRAALEVRDNLAAIRRFTGTRTVDVEGHSMGGLSVRVYLDQFGWGVGKFLMVGTPNRGTSLAEVASWAVENQYKVAMAIGGLSSHALPALQWLRPEASNPDLRALNQRWAHQRARVEDARIVGTCDLPTLCGDVFGEGDGKVAVVDLPLPGVEVKVLGGRLSKHHGLQMHDSDVFREGVDFFGWEKAS